ncbi:1388_t:CDS:1, partial [Dentiscutata heterogama]
MVAIITTFEVTFAAGIIPESSTTNHIYKSYLPGIIPELLFPGLSTISHW